MSAFIVAEIVLQFQFGQDYRRKTNQHEIAEEEACTLKKEKHGCLLWIRHINLFPEWVHKDSDWDASN